MTHWTSRVYRAHGHLLHDVEAAIFQNHALTDYELAMMRRSAAEVGVEITEPVLDLACGPGRHTLRLTADSLAVTGVDLSETLLAIARRAATATASNGLSRFVCGDMRHLPLRDGFFASVILLGNSFGYFSEEQNLKVVEEAHRVLAEGGLFCVELTDREAYLPHFRPYEQERIQSRAFGELESRWWKWWDAGARRLRTWESHRSRTQGAVLYQGSYDVRLYDRSEIESLLKRIGFRNVTSLAGKPKDLNLRDGLGETLGSVGEVLFVSAVK